jgi:xanthine dehydrogenase YagS FAD-binding subunit
MARIRDMMGSFELFQPTELGTALDLLRRHGKNAWVLSGGMDTFDWLKDRAKSPSVVVDLGGIPGLKGVQETADGLEIGAMTTLTEVSRHPDLVARFPLLTKAAAKVASPQIRHQGTLGGNLCQDTRCWYYRSGWSCYRAGGNTCFANAPRALNREHAIFEGNRCVAVSPSDTAPALIALDAQMVLRSARQERVVTAQDFFLTPATDIERMTVLQPGELLTSIRIPTRWAGAAHYFEKLADRASWDFALVSISATVDRDGSAVRDSRIVMGAVSPRPLRLTAVEDFVRGKALTDDVLSQAGEIAIQGARALNLNEYKIPLTRNLVRRALQEASV